MLDQIEETLAIPQDGLVIVRLPERTFRRDGVLIGNELKVARDRAGSKCTFLVMPSSMRVEELPDEQLALAGLQRIEKV